MKHLGLQDEQRASRLGTFDVAGVKRALCGHTRMACDIVWLDVGLERELPVDKYGVCQLCIAEWVERRLTKEHAPYNCGPCQETFALLYELLAHQRQKHPEMWPP